MATTKRPRIHPEVRDIWIVARIVQMTIGFHLGLYLYVYGVFFYEAFGGARNSIALALTAAIFITMEIVCLFTEVPTGALGDYIGRKKTVALAFIFRALYFFSIAWVPFISSVTWAFTLSVIAVTCFGIGYTFYSGSFVAWVVDSLKARNHPEASGIILGRSYAHMTLAQIVGALISLSLYFAGYIYYAFALGFTSAVLCAVFCYVMMKETQNLNFYQGKLNWKNSTKRMKEIIVNGVKISIQTPAVLYLMLMYSGFMFLTHVVMYLWPVAMKANFGVGKMTPYWYLIVFSCLALTFLGAKGMEWLSHSQTSLNSNNRNSNVSTWLWFASVALMMAAPIFYLSLKTKQGEITLFIFVMAVVLSQLGYGFLRPCYETLINHYIPPEHSQERATIMSFASMLVSAMVIFLMIPSAGKTGEQTTIGWLIPSGLLAGLTLVIHVLMRRYQRKIGELPSKVEKAPEVV